MMNDLMTTAPSPVDLQALTHARAVEAEATLELELARHLRMSTGEWCGQVRKPEGMSPEHFEAGLTEFRRRATDREREVYLMHLQAVASREALEKELAGETDGD